MTNAPARPWHERDIALPTFIKPLYFDYNATTPVLEPVFTAMAPYLNEHFGNPGSDHAWGLAAARAVDSGRQSLASLIGCSPNELYYTSCATESINIVLQSVMAEGGHLVTTAVEHPATLQTAKALESRGVSVSLAPVDDQGLVSLEAVKATCTPETKLISVMLANNEVGTLQPVAEIAAWARSRGILMHTDAAQAVAKIPVDVKYLGVDFMTIAGHKIYAPKGIGALYVRSGVELAPLTYGGGQERGLRPGTENVPYIVALGAAAEMALADLETEAQRQRDLGQRLLAGIDGLGKPYLLHAADAPRLPTTMSIGFGGLLVGDILSGLVGEDVGVSAGAACHGDHAEPSHVLKAMNVPQDFAQGTLRISWGRPTTAEDVDEFVLRLGRVLSSL